MTRSSTPAIAIRSCLVRKPGIARARPAGVRGVHRIEGPPEKARRRPATPAGFVRVRGAREHNLQERRRRHPARRAGRLHRRVGLGQVVAGLRHALRRGAAPLPRVGRAVRAPPVPPDRRARGRRDRRPAARRRAAAAARHADHALVGRQRHDAVEPAADALFARRRLPAAASRCSTPRRSRRTRRRAPARRATGSAASTT